MRIRIPSGAQSDAPPPRTVHTAGNREVSVYDYGDPAGAPVFALHGTPACGAGFDLSEVPARERGLRIIAPDRPGIGHSTAVPLPAVADYAPEFAALADALEISRFTLLGYSGGGPYALAVAAALGERVQSMSIIAGAGEIGTWATLSDLARSDRQLTWLALHVPIAARVTLRTAELLARVAPRVALWSAEEGMGASDRAVMSALGSPRQSLALFTQALTHSSAGVVEDYARLGRPWNVDLSRISVPVHCWHGTADTFVPLAHTEALLERLPQARLTTWPGEGHLALITHVEEVLDDIAATIRAGDGGAA